MTRRVLLVLLCAALLAGCGGSTPPVARLGATDVVVAFGDSLTYGTGAKPEESYPAVLGQLINRTVVRAGVPGEQTAGGLARLPGTDVRHGLIAANPAGIRDFRPPGSALGRRQRPVCGRARMTLGKLRCPTGKSHHAGDEGRFARARHRRRFRGRWKDNAPRSR